ncbi:MAG: hypothetical protein ACYSYU_06205 [Planctomycetota bacterium]
MSLMEINWNPADKELRNFGKIAITASVLAAVLLYLTNNLALRWCVIIAGIGLICFLSSILSITLARWIYLGLTLITFPIGIAVSSVLLAIFYYLLLTPIGLIFRLMRRDSLRRKFDPDAKSYWIVRKLPDNLKHYFNHF